LGSNIGNREETLLKSIALLNEKAGNVIAVSSLYETEPWKMENAGGFINQAVEVRTQLSAEELMDTLLAIEQSLGRTRNSEKYESRTIDLDILFYNNSILSTEKVKIPHPLLHQRNFVLEPLAEIAPAFIHPKLKKNITQLLLECKDSYTVARMMSK
jgi:2-amino-4-hydroxy-6-hydroxymethyldihydropteridine diphosphokinase